MADARLIFESLTGNFAREMKAIEKPVAAAATAAVREAGEIVKAEARAEFSAKGFGRSGQNSMRAAVTPRQGESINAAVDFFLRPAFWSVFENGAVIHGKPLLWLPTDNVPLGRGRSRLTPRQYTRRLGRLVSAKGSDKPMLLGRSSRASVLRATTKVVRLRKRAVKLGTLQGALVPMFIGVPLVTVGKRVDLEGIVKRVGDRMGELYLKHFKPPKK